MPSNANCNLAFFFVLLLPLALNCDLNWMHAILHNVRITPAHLHTHTCGTAMCALNRYIIMHNWAKDGFGGEFFFSSVFVALSSFDPDALSSPCSMHCFFAFHFRLLFKPVNCQLFHWSPNHSICKAIFNLLLMLLLSLPFIFFFIPSV